MDEDSTQALRVVLLPSFGVLRIAGDDALSFLQGQLTNDVRQLADGRTQLSACCTSQGRVIALLRLRQTEEAIYALMPADLLGRLATHIRKFVLRAKVEILQAADLHVGAILTGSAAAAAEQQAIEESAMTMSPVPLAGATEVVTFQYAEGREVLAAPPYAWRSIGGLSLARANPRSEAAWLAADAAAGLPQVFASTSEHFTPQMLNLDLLAGVSFSKGCYTGQEIVTRTQHLGRVKRRTMRFRLPAGASVPSPMTSLLLDGAKAADVLLCAEDADGHVEMLAVTNLDATGRELVTEGGVAATPAPVPYEIAVSG
jgi:folate-binding protein YgfZ